MHRSERLLNLIQVLRRHRAPVSGQVLADELGVSIRTLYRDIVTLQGQGAHIQGEPGLGYVLKPGFMLPPLMFSEDEIEAITLGIRWAARRSDARLGLAARNAGAKIAAVLPPELRREMESSTLLIGPDQSGLSEPVDLTALRIAIRKEHKLRIAYRDKDGSPTVRTIWPFALGFFDKVKAVVAWCELRDDFRMFRVDRMDRIDAMDERMPRRRLDLMKAWKESEAGHAHGDATATI
ncbi:MAG: helix-turn-helix transcriptional regulator [Rhizobiaceae bacterium]